MIRTTSFLDEPDVFDAVKNWIEQGETNSSIAANVAATFKVPTSEKSIRRFRKRHGFSLTPEKPGYKIKGDDAEVTTPAEGDLRLDDPDKMIRDRGLDPQDWIIDGVIVNQWGPPDNLQYQAKLTLRRKQPEVQLIAARSDGWVAPPRTRWLHDTPKLVVITGDQQAPFHDERLHDLFCSWLRRNKPIEGILLGDTVDFPDVSRHRFDPENTAKVNECTQAGYDLLRGYVDSSPETFWKKMPGNHDERIRNLLLDHRKVTPLYGVERAAAEGQERERVLEVPYLLRLDELGIEWIDPQGPYEQAQINLSKYLAVRHGWIVRKGAGESARATLEHLGYSIVVGHTHRQSLVHKTTHDIDGTPTTIVGVEAGCMCRVDCQEVDGRIFPSYTVNPDWQQGFATATVHPNGKFRVDLATYVDNTLLWRDQFYA